MSQDGRFGGVALLLAGGMLLLPFLVPLHAEPMRSFYSEWLAAFLGELAFIALLLRQGRLTAPMPAFAVWLLALALLLAGRAVLGDPAYPQLPLWGAGYLLYAVLMVWLGRLLALDSGLDRAGGVLAAFVLAGAVLNALAGLIQWLGVPYALSDIIAALPQRRAYGNVAQANLFANYLAVGEAALILFWASSRIGTVLVSILGALLVLAGALSASRMALAYPIYFAVLSLWFCRKQSGGPALRRLFRASLVFALAVLFAHAALALLQPGSGDFDSPALARSGESLWLRRDVWISAWRIFADAPWFGIGLGEFPGGLFDSSTGPLADGSQVWSSPHNLLLQLLSETGIAGTLLVVLALLVWANRVERRVAGDASITQWWLLAVVGVELLHSMVEYPLWSAHFLGLLAIVMGMSAAHPAADRPSVGTRIAGALACILVLGALVWVIDDYWRLDAVGVTGANKALPRPWSADDAGELRALAHGPLGPLAEVWRCTGMLPDRGNLEDTLPMTQRVMRFRPSTEVAARRALALALAGRQQAARELAARLGRSPVSARVSISLFTQSQSPEGDALAALPRYRNGAEK